MSNSYLGKGNLVLEPTDKQRSDLDDLQGPITLVQFHVIRDQAAFEHYRSTSEEAVVAVGGQRKHDANIDQVLAGGEMPYQAITVDQFSTRETLLTVFDAVSGERGAALSEIYALLVSPKKGLSHVVKALGFLSPLFSRWLGTNTEKEMVGFAEHADPETGPIPETVEVMRRHDQTTPFYMMNLNKYFPTAQYANGEGMSGEQAYNRYAAKIAPYLVSVSGYPAIIGLISGVFVGDESSPLHDDWSEFAMVFYPSRQNFIRMMSNSPTKGVYHREAGLQRAILMPSSSFSNDN